MKNSPAPSQDNFQKINNILNADKVITNVSDIPNDVVELLKGIELDDLFDLFINALQPKQDIISKANCFINCCKLAGCVPQSVMMLDGKKCSKLLSELIKIEYEIVCDKTKPKYFSNHSKDQIIEAAIRVSGDKASFINDFIIRKDRYIANRDQNHSSINNSKTIINIIDVLNILFGTLDNSNSPTKFDDAKKLDKLIRDDVFKYYCELYEKHKNKFVISDIQKFAHLLDSKVTNDYAMKVNFIRSIAESVVETISNADVSLLDVKTCTSLLLHDSNKINKALLSKIAAMPNNWKILSDCFNILISEQENFNIDTITTILRKISDVAPLQVKITTEDWFNLITSNEHHQYDYSLEDKKFKNIISLRNKQSEDMITLWERVAKCSNLSEIDKKNLISNIALETNHHLGGELDRHGSFNEISSASHLILPFLWLIHDMTPEQLESIKKELSVNKMGVEVSVLWMHEAVNYFKDLKEGKVVSQSLYHPWCIKIQECIKANTQEYLAVPESEKRSIPKVQEPQEDPEIDTKDNNKEEPLNPKAGKKRTGDPRSSSKNSKNQKLDPYIFTKMFIALGFVNPILYELNLLTKPPILSKVPTVVPTTALSILPKQAPISLISKATISIALVAILAVVGLLIDNVVSK